MKLLEIAVVCLAMVGCGGGSAPGPQASADAAEGSPAGQTGELVEVTLADPVIENGQLQLRGRTNLPDGALLSFVVEHDGFASGDFDGYVEGVITVEGGAFSHDVNIATWPRGFVETRLSFDVNPKGAAQPATIVDRYGANGERMTGPNVMEVGTTKKLLTSANTEIS